MKYDEKSVKEKVIKMLNDAGIDKPKISVEDYENLVDKAKEFVIAFIDCRNKCEQFDLIKQIEKNMLVLS